MSKDEEADYERVKAACQTLAEHYDSVHIFATRHEPSDGGTINISYGVGNWFARFGQVEQWVTKEKEQTKINVREQQKD